VTSSCFSMIMARSGALVFAGHDRGGMACRQ
jgi:hypothetical protein